MHLFSIAVALLAFVGSAVAQDASPDALKDLAPIGKLRAAINLGNGVLAKRTLHRPSPKASRLILLANWRSDLVCGSRWLFLRVREGV